MSRNAEGPSGGIGIFPEYPATVQLFLQSEKLSGISQAIMEFIANSLSQSEAFKCRDIFFTVAIAVRNTNYPLLVMNGPVHLIEDPVLTNVAVGEASRVLSNPGFVQACEILLSFPRDQNCEINGSS